MKAEWNTPPNGDFVRYVEGLTAQAARNLGRGQTDVTGEHGLDVGMTSSAGPGAVVPPAQARARAAAAKAAKSESAQGGPFGALTKPLLGAAGVAFVILWSIGVPIYVLVVLAGLAFWFAGKLKSLAFPGAAKWQQVLEEANRRGTESQQGKASK